MGVIRNLIAKAKEERLDHGDDSLEETDLDTSEVTIVGEDA